MKLRIDMNVCRVCKSGKSSVLTYSLFGDTNIAEQFCYLTGLEVKI